MSNSLSLRRNLAVSIGYHPAGCRFDDKELLISKIAAATIEGLTIQQIFDGRLFDADNLYVL